MATPVVVDVAVLLPRLVTLAAQLESGIVDGTSVATEALELAEEARAASLVAPEQDPSVVEDQIERIADIDRDFHEGAMALVGDDLVVVRAPGISLRAVGDGGSAAVSLDTAGTTVSATSVDEQGRSSDDVPDGMSSLSDLARVGLRAAGLGGGTGSLFGVGPTRITVVEHGRITEDVTVAGGAVLVDHIDIEAMHSEIEADFENAFAAGEAALEDAREQAEAGADEFVESADPEAEQLDVDGDADGALGEGLQADAPVGGADTGGGVGDLVGGRAGRVVAGGLATGAAAVARERFRRRRERREDEPVEQTDAPAPIGPAPTGPPPSAARPAPEAVAFEATHQVKSSGTTIGSVDSGTPPSDNLAGLPIRHISDSTSGWALVECSNGARCWVDPADLQSIPVPTEAPLYWCHVLEPADLQASDGRIVGRLHPGQWYGVTAEADGWATTTDENGATGWVPLALIQRHS